MNALERENLMHKAEIPVAQDLVIHSGIGRRSRSGKEVFTFSDHLAAIQHRRRRSHDLGTSKEMGAANVVTAEYRLAHRKPGERYTAATNNVGSNHSRRWMFLSHLDHAA